jgi:hypothetical protein
MRILTYSEYTSKKLSQYESNNIEASSMNKDIAEEKEQLIKEINKIVGAASEAGIEIQISDDELIKGKLYIKVLINEIEHYFSLEGNLLKIKTMEGGMLDNVKGNSDKILNILIGKTPRTMYTSESNEN